MDLNSHFKISHEVYKSKHLTIASRALHLTVQKSPVLHEFLQDPSNVSFERLPSSGLKNLSYPRIHSIVTQIQAIVNARNIVLYSIPYLGLHRLCQFFHTKVGC